MSDSKLLRICSSLFLLLAAVSLVIESPESAAFCLIMSGIFATRCKLEQIEERLKRGERDGSSTRT